MMRALRERVPVRAVRAVALVAFAGPVAYVLLTLLLGSLWTGYDPIRDTQSELGASDCPYRWVMNLAGFVGLGLAIVAFAAAYAVVLRDGRATRAAAALSVVAGLGMVAVGFFSCDPGCVDASWTGRVHAGFSAAGAIGLPTAAIVSSWVFARDGRFGTSWQVASLCVGILALGSGPAMLADVVADANGLLQRAGMWLTLLWVSAVSLRLLALTRSPPALVGAGPRPTHRPAPHRIRRT